MHSGGWSKHAPTQRSLHIAPLQSPTDHNHRMPPNAKADAQPPRGIHVMLRISCALFGAFLARFDHRCQSVSALAALCVCRTRHYLLIGTLKASHARSSRTIPSGEVSGPPTDYGCTVA